MLITSEPFNLDTWAYHFNGLAKYWFMYAPALNQEEAREAFQRVLDRRTGRVFGRRHLQRYLRFTRAGRLIIKDPIACFSSEWLYQNFDLDVVVIVRHPAAFALSLKRMNWSFAFDNLLKQERLMDELLTPYAAEISSKPESIIDQAALIWKLIYHVLGEFSERNKSWLVVSHEELSLDAVVGIQRLYEKLALSWSDQIEEKILAATSLDNPLDPKQGVAHQMKRDSVANVDRWKRNLSRDEVQRIRKITAGVVERYYSEESWRVPE